MLEKTHSIKFLFSTILILFSLSTSILFILFTSTDIPILAVFITTLAIYLASMIWYSPFLFGSYFEYKIATDDVSQTLRFIASFFLFLLLTSCFALLVQWTKPSSLLAGLYLATALWLGFSVSYHLRNALWLSDRRMNSWIHIVGDLIKFIIIIFILLLWPTQQAPLPTKQSRSTALER